jgi:glucose dehydrogenase
MRFRVSSAALMLMGALTAPASANDDVLKQTANPDQWARVEGDYAATRYSTLNQITTSNVGQLKVAWTFSTGVLRGHESAPLVIGNMMYMVTPFPNIVYALNLDDDHKIEWAYTPKQDPAVVPIMCCDVINSGVQYAEGKIFLYQADTSLVALDAKTGKELWKSVNGDPKKGESGTMAPIIVKDR